MQKIFTYICKSIIYICTYVYSNNICTYIYIYISLYLYLYTKATPIIAVSCDPISSRQALMCPEQELANQLVVLSIPRQAVRLCPNPLMALSLTWGRRRSQEEGVVKGAVAKATAQTKNRRRQKMRRTKGYRKISRRSFDEIIRICCGTCLGKISPKLFQVDVS